jgi:MerR HTH family regulatory protein/NUMOD1 domain
MNEQEENKNGTFVNATELAKALGVAKSSITGYLKNGLMHHVAGTTLFDLDVCSVQYEFIQAKKSHDLINQTEAARVLKVSVSTLSLWKSKGEITPKHTDGKACWYSKGELLRLKERKDNDKKPMVVEATLVESGSKEELEAIYLARKIHLADIKIAEKEGVLIPINEVRNLVSAMLNVLGDFVNQAPTRLASDLRFCTTDEERLVVVEKEANELLKNAKQTARRVLEAPAS